MKNLDDIFDKIRKENLNYDEIINNGNIFFANCTLLDKRITPDEMIYIMAYYTYYKDIKKADIFIRDKVSKEKLAKIKKHLAKLGYLNIINRTPNELKNMTIELSHKGKKCEWCQKESYVLQEHHFPILNKNGGTDIVLICPNCHYTFHKLELERYE